LELDLSTSLLYIFLIAMRKDLLVNNNVYHILNKSIAGYVIFNNSTEFERMIQIMQYYLIGNPAVSFSRFNRASVVNQEALLASQSGNKQSVKIIAYCIMPTHFHLILEQIANNGISKYINNISNSYTRYFNLKHNRKGPLWQGRFKSVLVENDNQLLHLTRYLHLNPVTSGIINEPKMWEYSSYIEYLNESTNKICEFDLISVKPIYYRRFVTSQKTYQRRLSIIKKQLLD